MPVHLYGIANAYACSLPQLANRHLKSARSQIAVAGFKQHTVFGFLHFYIGERIQPVRETLGKLWRHVLNPHNGLCFLGQFGNYLHCGLHTAGRRTHGNHINIACGQFGQFS